ncbi:hypothetical protein HYFRA_00004034 [Hymenoscyphus fraxineus]|uniref:PLAC8 family protein n=1 Tax=Hymenoscyphus fraxineus TaxID=746836 RepID=A0A9N9PKC1_9HELO|nr:hypothetical protein HYFRA_00004034 [Hymenoscyphus fraxineus]
MSDIKQSLPQPKSISTNMNFQQAKTPTGEAEWEHGLFDCFKGEDLLLGVQTYFCPCITYGKTQARTRDPTLGSYELINTDCLMWTGAHCFGISWLLSCMKRTEIRESYNIRGDNVTDCLLSWCCNCCTLMQQEKEVIAKQKSGVVKQGYQAPTGMTIHGH